MTNIIDLSNFDIFSKYQFPYIVGGATPVGAGKTSLMYGFVRPHMTPPLVDERLDKIRQYINSRNSMGGLDTGALDKGDIYLQ